MKIKTKDGEEIIVEFADSFFETFPGTDEEMQELLTSLSEMISDGTFFDKAEPFDVEDLDEDEADALMEALERREKAGKRTLQ